MIVDKIENVGLYKGLSKNVANALELLASLASKDLSKLEEGKHSVNGDDLFYTVQSYFTRDESSVGFEAHKEYIDIQYIFEGRETIGVAITNELRVSEEYNPERDFIKLKDPEAFTRIRLSKDMFAVFYPSDAHKPGTYGDSKSRVGKVVIKVKVNS